MKTLSRVILFVPVIALGACASGGAQPRSPDAGSASDAHLDEALATVSEPLTGDTCAAFLDCLELGIFGGAACESSCFASASCGGLSGDGGRTTLASCLRYRGGLGCFPRHCGEALDERDVVCPDQAACLRGGGGYACFARDCRTPTASDRVATVLARRGSVEHRRIGSYIWRQAPEPGGALYFGDLFRVGRGASLTLRCRDGSSWTMREGTSGVANYCPR